MPAPAHALRTSRPRNSAASREALLNSARRLFSEQGFEQTTVRDIGDDAGVDPALIARYFGSKVNLYLATVTAEDADSGRPEDLREPAELVEWFVGRVERRGPGPVLQALVRSDTAPEIREAAREHLTRRLVEPITRMLAERGAPDARVRAEVAVTAFTGVLLARALRSFDELAGLGRKELTALLTGLLEELAGSA